MGKKKSTSSLAHIDEEAKRVFNYGVLLRHDPHLAQIYVVSSICNVYHYNIDRAEWDKAECQGTLFIYSRTAKEDIGVGNTDKYPYGLVVLNRLGVDDFTLGITPLSISSKTGNPELAVDIEGNFIMIQSADGAMYGLWIFNENDRQLVLTTLQQCIGQSPTQNIQSSSVAIPV